jgi:hypothetical protein
MSFHLFRRASIPQDTQCLIVTCHPTQSALFKGIEQVCTLIKKKKYFYVYNWDGTSLNCLNHSNLAAIVLSGHGKLQQAGLAGARNLSPAVLKLPPTAGLYLVSCYQGKEGNLAAWAKKTGLAPNRIFAYDDEVEVVLSTLFFIMLHEYGLAGLPAAFQRWQYANKYLKPFFPLVREIYKRNNYNFIPAVDEIKTIINLDTLGDMVKLGRNYHTYLSGLC